MRILHFADLHLDTQFAWAPRDLATKRRQALRSTLDNIIKLANDEKVEAIFCGGDLYEHERFSPDTAEFLRKAFESVAPLPVFISPGNHDWFGPNSLYATVDWSANVTIFKEDRLTPVELTDGLTLWGAAHRAPANTDGFLDGFTTTGSGVHIALFHGSERAVLGFQEEGKQPHAPFNASQIESAGLNFLFAGHFHTPSDQHLLTYPGNPDPLRFGETGTRGAVIAAVGQDGLVHLDRHVVATSAVHDLALDISACTSFHDVRKEVSRAAAGLGGVARLTIFGELQPDVELDLGSLRGAAPNLDALLPRAGSLHPGYDIERIKQEQTVRGQFLRDLMAGLPQQAAPVDTRKPRWRQANDLIRVLGVVYLQARGLVGR